MSNFQNYKNVPYACNNINHVIVYINRMYNYRKINRTNKYNKHNNITSINKKYNTTNTTLIVAMITNSNRVRTRTT